MRFVDILTLRECEEEKEEVNIYKTLSKATFVTILSLGAIKLVPLLGIGTAISTSVTWLNGGIRVVDGIMIPNKFMLLIYAMFGVDTLCELKNGSNKEKKVLLK
jgi:hypothetical protein